MPKRSTTDEAIGLLTDADKLAAERKAAALATIPAPEWNDSIPFVRVFSDHDLNSRHGETYAKADNLETYTSLKDNGLQRRGDPMVFHLETDGRFKTLAGHIRLSQMLILENEYRENPETGRHFETVFGLVYTGLTRGQQLALVADHIGKKDLTEAQRCKEIAAFQLENGLTDAATSTHFGIDVNRVMRYRMRWAMPTVFDNYVLETTKGHGKPFVKVKQKQLTRLYTAYLEDLAATNKPRTEGPAFRKMWDIVKADPSAFTTPGTGSTDDKPKSLEPGTIKNQADGSVAAFGEGPEIVAIADALRWAAGDKTIDLVETRQRARDYADGLRAEVETLRAQVETLRTEADELSSALTEARTEADGLRDELTEARSEVAALKARKPGNGHSVKSK